MLPKVDRHKAAIGRTELSRPLKFTLDAGFIGEERTFFDYGCGRGDDVQQLREMGFPAKGWDPSMARSDPPEPSDVINLGYVVNVIEDTAERAAVLRKAWSLTKSVLVIAARLTIDVKKIVGEPFGDGVITRLGTFQKYYQQSELRSWIHETLGEEPVAASTGVFFVFRDVELRERYLASRYTRRRAAPKPRKSDVLFERHRELLQPLLDFYTDRARLPEISELDVATELIEIFRSLRKAFAVVKRVTGTEPWEAARTERQEDLLVHFALGRFARRPRMSDLPRALQLDVRELFSSYKAACEAGDELLFEAGNMELVGEAMHTRGAGKLTPSALYIHIDALHELSPILRVYEGCARRYVGDVAGANLVKLARDQPRVSYLTYPDFDTDPHPSLDSSLVVSLSALTLDLTVYRDRENPPVLHRKESYLGQQDPRRGKFERLTHQEEQWGLYAQPERIGTREGWRAVLAEAGCDLRGHRLVRTSIPIGATSVPKTTILEACMRVLQDADGPLSASEIYDRIVQQNLFTFQAKDPLAILRSSIRKHLRGAPPHRLAVVEGGKYAPTA